MQLALLYKICYTPLLPFYFMNLRADLFVQQCQISLSLHEGSWIALLLYCSFLFSFVLKIFIISFYCRTKRTKIFFGKFFLYFCNLEGIPQYLRDKLKICRIKKCQALPPKRIFEELRIWTILFTKNLFSYLSMHF